MGNSCTVSKLSQDANADGVASCRNRKRLIKATVDHYHALAQSHATYTLSLNSVAAAIKLFIAAADRPKTPPEPNTQLSGSPVSSLPSPPLSPMPLDMDGGYCFFSEALPSPPSASPSPARDYSDGFRTSEEDYMRAVRDQEGIPELEEEEEAEETEKDEGSDGAVNDAEVVEEVECLAGMETPTREPELLQALRDVEEQFIRASQAGKDLSRMLQANRVLRNSGLTEIKDNSLKLIRAITRSHSSSSLSSSSLYKSSLASSSKKSSFIESGSDFFDNCGRMASESHSQTLGRLYVWEKKLYDEVKARDDIQHAYEKKCSQLRNQEAKGADSRSVDKNKMIVRDLHTRAWVALQSIETISKKIEELRDEELQPQLIELIQGLMKTWKIMLESHETQNQILFEVVSFSCPTQGRLHCDFQRSVILRLETELRNWRTCFMNYIEAQRAYVEALYGWLSNFYLPHTECNSRERSSIPSHRVGVPPLLAMCHDWINSYRKLPSKAVSNAMKGFIKDISELWVRQGEEQQQKRRVDCLAKKLDIRIIELQNRVLETNLSELKPESVMHRRGDDLAGRKDLIDMLRKKLHKERSKHQDCIQKTQRATRNGFKMSLSKVFESLSEFSKDSVELYDGLLMQNKKSKMAEQMKGKPSSIECSTAGVDER